MAADASAGGALRLMAAAPIGEPRSRARSRLKQIRGHGGLGLDQVVSSLTNMLATVVVAHTVSLSDLGRFAIVYTIYTFALGLSRAYIHEPLLINYPLLPDGERRGYVHRAYGATLTLGIAVSALCLVLTLPLGTFAPVLLPLAGCVPFLLLQDVVRYEDFAQKRSRTALVSDSAWLLLFCLTGFLAEGLLWVSLAWGVSGAISALLVRPSGFLTALPHIGLRWFSRHRTSGGFFAMEFFLTQAVLNCGIWFTGALLSVASAGAFRVGQVLVAPVKTLSGAVIVAALPRMSGAALGPMVRRSRLFTAVVAITALLTCVALLVVPDSLGRLVVGGAWEEARPIALVLGLAYAVSAFTQGRMLIIKGTRRFKRSVLVRSVEAPFVILSGLVGTLIGGATGAAVGLLIASALGFPWWARAARKAMTDYVA